MVLRELAHRDVEEAVDWYRDHADVATALRFVSALEAALRHLARQPRSGSPRWVFELDLPGLRSWPLTGFPFLVFHVEHDRVVDVWRVLHARRDIPTWLVEPDDADGEG